MTDWRDIAKNLYKSLKPYPCRCQKHWTKTATGAQLVAVELCSRCAAVGVYEAAIMIEAEEKAQ